MNLYEAEYQSKKVTIEEALDSLKDGDVIGTSQCANEPTAFFDAIDHLRSSGKHFRMFAPMCFSPHRFLSDPIYQNTFDMDITFLMGATRKGREQGLLSYYPGDLHNGASRWIEVNGCNVFIAAATPMDRHGYFMIPLCLIHEKTFLEAADRVILQVNPNLPRIYGDTEVHIRDVDMIVEAETPLPYLPVSTPNELEMTIGNYVASLVNDGDCIQLGIGGIPDAAALALKDKHDLGVHSEMITNSMVELVKQGVITGRRKNFMPGKIVGTFAYGTQALYDLLEENPGVRMLRGETVNNPQIVAQNDNFVSINACLSVDLTGQVCSESIAPGSIPAPAASPTWPWAQPTPRADGISLPPPPPSTAAPSPPSLPSWSPAASSPSAGTSWIMWSRNTALHPSGAEASGRRCGISSPWPIPISALRFRPRPKS